MFKSSLGAFVLLVVFLLATPAMAQNLPYGWELPRLTTVEEGGVPTFFTDQAGNQTIGEGFTVGGQHATGRAKVQGASGSEATGISFVPGFGSYGSRIRIFAGRTGGVVVVEFETLLSDEGVVIGWTARRVHQSVVKGAELGQTFAPNTLITLELTAPTATGPLSSVAIENGAGGNPAAAVITVTILSVKTGQ